MRRVGTIWFQLDSKDYLHLVDVVFVPGLKEKGYKVAFVDGQVVVWPQDSSIELAWVIGVREGGLYRLTGWPISCIGTWQYRFMWAMELESFSLAL